MDIVNPAFYFSFDIENQYALLWTPNAYCDMLMRIFTSCLFFQCILNNFQCIITLLRTLSVALLRAAMTIYSLFNKDGPEEMCEYLSGGK